MSGTRRILTWAFALLGLGASATSAWVHHRLLTQPNFTSFCDVNETVNCASAYLSPYGSLFGVPVAVLGGLWFVAVVALLAAARPGSTLAENLPGYLLALSTVGLGVILYLAFGAFVVLRTVCLLCVATYVAVIGLFVVSAVSVSFPMRTLPVRAWRDLRAALSNPLAVVALLILGGGAVTAIAAFPRGDGTAPGRLAGAAAPAPTDGVGQPAQGSGSGAGTASGGLTPQQQAQLEQWYAAQPKAIVPVDGGGAAVVIVKFNDFQCPPCRQTYEEYKPILAKYDRLAPGKVRMIVKHFPIDPECNVNSPGGTHYAACEAAAAMVMAGSGAKADALESWLFGNQATLTPMSVRTAAREIAGITDFEARYPQALEQVKADIALARLLNVQATPTFFVNGTHVRGGMPPQFFDALIALELKRAAQ